MNLNETMRYLCDDKIYNQVKNALYELNMQELQKMQEAKISVILNVIESANCDNAERIDIALKKLDDLYDVIDNLIENSERF